MAGIAIKPKAWWGYMNAWFMLIDSLAGIMNETTVSMYVHIFYNASSPDVAELSKSIKVTYLELKDPVKTDLLVDETNAQVFEALTKRFNGVSFTTINYGNFLRVLHAL